MLRPHNVGFAAGSLLTVSYTHLDVYKRQVERDTQKGIIIGHKGSAIKRVGVEARQDLEKFFGKQIHIEMFVKVNKDWRNNAYQLRRFGYNQK